MPRELKYRDITEKIIEASLGIHAHHFAPKCSIAIVCMIKSLVILLMSLPVLSPIVAQHQVQFIVNEQTYIKHDSIYIVGSFNGWDSLSNVDYLLQPFGENQKSITLPLNAGMIKYKFHRGNWLTVEKDNIGNEVKDREVFIDQDTTLIDSVQSWRDQVILDKKEALSNEQNIPEKVNILSEIARIYAFQRDFLNLDSAYNAVQKAIDLQQNLISVEHISIEENPEYYFQLIRVQEIIAGILDALGNYSKALEIRLENFYLAEQLGDHYAIAYVLMGISNDYSLMKDNDQVLVYAKQGLAVAQQLDSLDSRYSRTFSQINDMASDAYYNVRLYDSAIYYASDTIGLNPYAKSFNCLRFVKIHVAKRDRNKALSYFNAIKTLSKEIYIDIIEAGAHAEIAKLYQQEGNIDSALYCAQFALNYFQNNELDVQAWGLNSTTYIAEISPLIAELYQNIGQRDSAYKYLDLSVTLKDSLYNSDKIRQFQSLTFNETARRQQLVMQNEIAQEQFKTRIKMYALILGLLAIMLFAFVLYRNNVQKQRANELLEKQKQEITNTLGELKETQAQLIQSEKMASLGELTAGIAHEIQNPLNFVNNFSEVSNELIDEMNEELDNGDLDEAKAISTDIKQNLEKILHHGKRADGIVKGMLQHSRSNSGEKEPTDINALADEYLRLAYHGLRAKDKSFNATLETDFDESIGKVNIIPQDIGRVILNLITNAFYACNERTKAIENADYKPTVSVSTKLHPLASSPASGDAGGGMIYITVSDNGSGIPNDIKQKIFQPFFTTKATGEGTGLGLSLSYDIVKAHGGELSCSSRVNEGTEFIIKLPVD